MRYRNIIAVVVFVIAASAIYYSYVKIKGLLTYSETSITMGPEGEQPAMDISSFSLEETDGPDSVWTLKARKAEMFKGAQRIIFTDVETLVNGDKKAKNNYRINSEHGAYFMNEEKIVLEKNVTIQTSHGYKVLTDKLDYSIKTKKISSMDPVSIVGKTPGGQVISIEGVGIDGSLGNGDFKISKKIVTKFGSDLEISSKHAEFNTNETTVIFSGDVEARKGGLDIKGDKLTVNYTAKGDIRDIDVAGRVKIKAGEKKYALCERALIKGSSSDVILTGKPEFHADGDIIVGKKIVFYADSDEVYVEKVRAEVSEKTVRKTK